MDIIKRALLRTRRVNVLLAFGSALFGLCFAYILIEYSFFKMYARISFYEFTVFCLIDAFFLIYSIRKFIKTFKNWNISQNQLVKIIETEPRRIVWYYPHIFTVKFLSWKLATFPSIFVWYNDGKKQILQILPSDLEPLLLFIKNHCPKAIFGYSIYNRQTYAHRYYLHCGWFRWYLNKFPRLSRITEGESEFFLKKDSHN